MAISGRNKRRTRTRSAEELARIKEGTRQALLGAAEIGLFLIPGGAIIRLARVGGKFLPGAVDKLMRKFPGAKQIKNPSKAQIEKAQPPSSVKPKVRVPAKTRTTPNTSKEAGRGGTPPKTKPRVRVPAKTRTTPNTAKEAGRTKLTPKGKKLVAAGATGAAAGLTALGLAGKSTYDAVTKKDKSTRGPARTTPDTSSEKGRKRTPKVTRSGTAKVSPSAAAEKRNMKTYGKRLVPERSVSFVSAPAKTGAAFKKKKRKPTGTYDRSTVATSTGKARNAPSTVSEKGRKGTPKRTTKITAGPGVGFGPKGNQFPKDAADRRRLMAMYGGTGSAAAKAAAQGKQGNLKKGKK